MTDDEKIKDDLVIYRIKKDDVLSLVEALDKNGYLDAGEISVNSFEDVNVPEFQISMYVHSKKTEKPVWYEKYGFLINNKTKEIDDFISEVNADKKYFSGLILLEDKINDDTYALTFGSAFHVIKKYCDSDFGFEVAEKVGDKNSISTADLSNFIGDVARKFETYENNTGIKEDEYGSAYNYLKIKSTFPQFIGAIKCGQACGVKIEGLTHQENLVNLLHALRAVSKIDEKKLQLPKIIEISNINECRRYEEALMADIFSETSNRMFISEYSIVGIQIYMNNALSYAFEYKDVKNKIEKMITFQNAYISEQEVRSFVESVKNNYTKENLNCFNLNFFKIIITYENGHSYPYNMLNLINYRIEIDNNVILLRNGKWHKFNDCFLDNISRAIENYEKDNKVEICKRNLKLNAPQKTKNGSMVYKDENEIIDELVSENANYKKVHPNLIVLSDFGRVELCDIYDENNEELIFVKRENGSQDLAYLVSQALNSVKVAKMPLSDANKKKVQIYTKKYEIKSVEKIKLIVISQDGMYDLHTRKLFNFKLDFCRLIKECISAKIKLSVQIINHEGA